jgi:hypothetical protein
MAIRQRHDAAPRSRGGGALRGVAFVFYFLDFDGGFLGRVGLQGDLLPLGGCEVLGLDGLEELV